MYRAKDQNRDQSYFLFAFLKTIRLSWFPLKEIDKSETRSIAEKLNLNVATKPDSQDICFVPNDDYASVIKKFRPESFQPGKIINLNGSQMANTRELLIILLVREKELRLQTIIHYMLLTLMLKKIQLQ